MNALFLLAAILIQQPLEPLKASRQGEYVTFEHPQGFGFDFIKITTDPPCEFTRWGGAWRGRTTATEGEFLGIVYDEERTRAYRFHFKVPTAYPELVAGNLAIVSDRSTHQRTWLDRGNKVTIIAILCVLLFTFCAARKGWLG